MNMLRLPGTGAYETGAFHDLCDELGILVWQDFMFANLDYPLADERFRETSRARRPTCSAALGARPSLAVLCGNSEVEQQAAMMGIDAAAGARRAVRRAAAASSSARAASTRCTSPPRPTAAISRSAPTAGSAPTTPSAATGCRSRTCAARACASPRSASPSRTCRPRRRSRKCSRAAPARLAGHDPLWKAGVPRENEADWDFEDIRDHYLRLLYGVDAADLRHVDRARYLELSRMLTGEILAEVFGEWRRAGSPCGGGLVLWLHDLLPGAGWGLVDHRGRAKLAYHHLARALAPVAVWSTDENLGGVVAHVANDRPAPLRASLRVALYREGERRVEQASVPVELAPHSQGEWNVEAVIGHFVDAAWAYKFGPPAQDAIVVSLEHADDGGAEDVAPVASAESTGESTSGEERACAGILSQAFRFPAGRPLEREPAERLGLAAKAQTLADGNVQLTISSRRLAYGVEIHAPGFTPSDAGFSIEPGGERVVVLRQYEGDTAFAGGKLTAVNLQGRVSIAVVGDTS